MKVKQSKALIIKNEDRKFSLRDLSEMKENINQIVEVLKEKVEILEGAATEINKNIDLFQEAVEFIESHTIDITNE